MWSNSSLRTAQHSTIQRPQGQTPSQGHQHQQLQSQAHDEGPGSAQTPFSTAGDEYRFGGQAGVGQLSGGSQPQTGNIEDFPPLGGAGVEAGPDRRTGMIQNAAAYGTSANTNAFPGLGQTRTGLSSPTGGQQDRAISSTIGERSLAGAGGKTPSPSTIDYHMLICSTGRTQFENIRGNAANLQDADRNVIVPSDPQSFTETNLSQGNSRSSQTLGNTTFLGSQHSLRGGDGRAVLPIGRPQPAQFEGNFATDSMGSPNTIPQHKKLADMTESERYGLPGLLSMIPLESPDYSSLAVGQDLTVLGLDLSRPE